MAAASTWIRLRLLPLVLLSPWVLLAHAGEAGAAELQWAAGDPQPLTTAAARNPAVAFAGGVTHVVYRRAPAGGIGHLWIGADQQAGAEQLLPGSAQAAVASPFNYPVLAVDQGGVAHVAWGPPSQSPGLGASYARVGADGQILAGEVLTSRWVEHLAVVVDADTVHVLANVIKTDPEPIWFDGVFHWSRPLAGGVWNEQLGFENPVFSELAATRDPGDDLRVVGRFATVKTLDRLGGQWQAPSDLGDPPGHSSVGRPTIVAALADAPVLAAIGWIDAVPNAVVVHGHPDPGWSVLPSAPLFDPATADGEPLAQIAVDELGRVAIAYLAADGPRLQLFLAEPGQPWQPSRSLAQTEAATSFALCGEGSGFRLVFATDDGTLWTGRTAVIEDPGGTDTGDGTGTGDSTDGDGTGTGTDGDGTGTDGDEGIDEGIVTGGDEVGIGDRDPDGCACRADPNRSSGAGSGLLLLALVGLRRRRAAR